MTARSNLSQSSNDVKGLFLFLKHLYHMRHVHASRPQGPDRDVTKITTLPGRNQHFLLL